jgi:hypothetical protein
MTEMVAVAVGPIWRFTIEYRKQIGQELIQVSKKAAQFCINEVDK